MTERGSGEPRGGQRADDRLLGAIEAGELLDGSRLRAAELAERDRGLIGDAAPPARTSRPFHRRIHACARDRFLRGTPETIRLSLAPLSGTTLARPDRAAIDEHAPIVARLRLRQEM